MAKSCKGLAEELIRCLSESECVKVTFSNHDVSNFCFCSVDIYFFEKSRII